MTMTTVSSLLQPEVLADAVIAGLAGVNVLDGTGAGDIRMGMPNRLVGSSVTVPYFASIGTWDQVTDESVGLTPAELTSSSETETVLHYGKAVDVNRFGSVGNPTDPYAEAQRQILDSIGKGVGALLIARALRNTASEWDAYTVNSSTRTINGDDIVEAQALFGEEEEDVVLFACAPKIKKDLALLKNSGGDYLFKTGENGAPDRVMGVPVKTSAAITATASVYTSALIKRNALVAWFADITDSDFHIQENPLTNSLVVAYHVYLAAHRYINLNGKTLPGVTHVKTL
jgi:hypothetical protein